MVAIKRPTAEELSRAIKLPEGLKCSDGRKFTIVDWMPVVKQDECLTAMLKVRIEMPK